MDEQRRSTATPDSAPVATPDSAPVATPATASEAPPPTVAEASPASTSEAAPASTRETSTWGVAAASPDPLAERPWLAAYREGVPYDVEVPDVPVTQILDEAAAAFPDRPALAFLGASVSYRELADQVDRCAAALRGLGVGKGDRVALVLPNCPQAVVAFYAAMRLGAVAVAHNPLYTAAEMEHQLADSGAVVAIVLDRSYPVVAAVRGATELRHVVVASLLTELPPLRRLALRLPVPALRRLRRELDVPVPAGEPVLRWAAWLRTARGPVPQEPVDPAHDVAVLQYTGGTTGVAKGAMLTHTNLLVNARQVTRWDPEAEYGKEVFLGVLPLFHAYGLSLCVISTPLLAGTLVLMPKFDLGLVFDAIDRWRPTIFPGVPPIYAAIVDSPEIGRHDLRSIRGCISGAMKLPVETVQRFEAATGGRMVEGYGMTETSPVIAGNPFSDRRKPGTIGIPIPNTWIRVVDPDHPDVEVARGTRGELLARGPQVFAGYWNRPEDTAATLLPGGWIRTGDVVEQDEDGFLTVVDRLKELIVTGGFNVYPTEVEEVLREHPAVEDCSVLGVPDPYRGETVKAVVVVREGHTLTLEQVRAHCRTRLTAYKVPKIVELREELPRNLVGKVLRRVLREEHVAAESRADGTPDAAAGSGAGIHP